MEFMERINRDGFETSREMLLAGCRGEDTEHAMGEIDGLGRAASYITGEPFEEVRARWVGDASIHPDVVAATREP